jgi:O-antigen ligase
VPERGSRIDVVAAALQGCQTRQPGDAMNQSRDFQLTAGLLALAFAVGGAGLSFPMLQLLLCICALGVAAWFVLSPRTLSPGPLDRWAQLLVALVVLLPLVQLIPLPPSIWLQLPGREVAAQIDGDLGWSIWRPWSLDVERTIRSWLILIPPVVIFSGCMRLAPRERRRLLWVVVAFALINALLGIFQLATGGAFTPYRSAHTGDPIGLFVNRNHSAMLFLAAMPVVGFVGAMKIHSGKPRAATLTLTLSSLVILAILIIGTTSRMALVLLPLALLIALFLIFFGEARWRSALPTTLALAAVGLTLFAFGGFNRSLSRFSSLHDYRFDFWTDLSWALQEYGLAGTGFGTFIPVHQSAESLAAVGRAVINHAHNDYLEILLEGGLPAIALLLMLVAILAASIIMLLRSRPSLERALSSVAASGAIVLLLLFSLVDYPLRMPALSGLFALLCALLLPSATLVPRPGSAGNDQPAARRWPLAARGAALLGLAGALALSVSAGLSARALQHDQPAVAAVWAPWSTRAHEQRATALLGKSRQAEALAAAGAALRLSPISTPAMRNVAIIRMMQGRTSAGDRLLEIASSLGWRDAITQLWAISAAQRSGEADKAVMRAEALFRQGHFEQPALILLLDPRANGKAREQLVKALAERPEWRRGLLRAGSTLQPAVLAQFEQLVAQLGATKAPPTMDEAQPLIDRFIADGAIGRAQHAWAATRGKGLILNGNFEDVSQRDGVEVPTDWGISGDGMTGLSLASPSFADKAGRSLRIVNARVGAPVISQRLMLAPGSYQLSYRSSAQQGSGVTLKWTLRCQGQPSGQSSIQEPGPRGRWGVAQAVFTVPNRYCPIQRLALQLIGDSRAHEIWLDDVIFRAG